MKAGPMAKGQLTDPRMTVKQEELPRLVHSLQVFFFCDDFLMAFLSFW